LSEVADTYTIVARLLFSKATGQRLQNRIVNFKAGNVGAGVGFAGHGQVSIGANDPGPAIMDLLSGHAMGIEKPIDGVFVVNQKIVKHVAHGQTLQKVGCLMLILSRAIHTFPIVD